METQPAFDSAVRFLCADLEGMTVVLVLLDAGASSVRALCANARCSAGCGGQRVERAYRTAVC